MIISPADLDLIKAKAKARRIEAIVERLTPLMPEQWQALNTHPDAKLKLAQAFGDAELFNEHLRKHV